MGIMIRSRSETAILMSARQDELDGLISRQPVWTAQQMQRGQTPVDAIETEMLGQPVLEFVFSLSANECQVRHSWVKRKAGDGQYPGFGCT
jgi:hypothetical protein